MCSPVTASQMAGFGPLVAQLSDLAAALAHGVDSGAWAGLPVAAAPAVLAELLAARDVIGAVASAGVSGVHAGGALPGGHVSTKQWLQHAAGLSAMSAGAELARAAALRDSFPETRVAALAGDLSQDKVRAITTGLQAAVGVLEPAARAAAITTVEHSLVDYARTATVEQVRRKVARLRFTLDPDGADARAMAAHDEQHLRFTPVGDGVAVDGWLTGETAAAVLTCLDQTVDTWFRSPAGARDPRDGEPSTRGCGPSPSCDGPGAVRRRASRQHLNALALGELAALLLGSGTSGRKHRVRPHLTVTVDLADYAAGLGGQLRLPGYGDTILARASADRIRCDADLTTVITRATPMAGATVLPTHADRDGVHSRDVSDPLGRWLHEQGREVLYVGRAERTAPPRLRRALEVRDGGCVAPGCAVDPSRCEAHHVTHWTHGGGTDLDNKALVCGRHHHLLHEGGHTLSPAPGRRAGQTGYWELHPPR